MMKKKLSIGLLALLVSLSAFAAQEPVVMLQQVSIKLLTQLVDNKSQLKHNPAILDRIVNATIIPYIDMDMMSRMVVGRNYWDSATSTQQQQFEQEFTRYVTRTYAAAFENYNNEKVLFYPIRGGVGDQDRVQVQSKIVRQSGPDVPLTYSLYRAGTTWKVYDISVEGVSMVQNYRAQFAGVLAQKGLVGLTDDLHAKNRERS